MNGLETIARARELQRALDETTDSLSWRLTAPLRRFRRRRTPVAALPPRLAEDAIGAQLS
jgi:hypothetical protein